MDQRGQASLEYVGVLALVAGVLAVALALVRAPDLAGSVAGGIRRALCVVASGDCLSRAGPLPCVTATGERQHEVSGRAFMLRLADGRTVLRETRSDGTVAVTITQAGQAGVGFLAGVEAQLGDHRTQAGGEVQGGGRLGFSRRYVRPDGPSADALIAWLDAHDPKVAGSVVSVARSVAGTTRGPAPDETRLELGTAADAGAALHVFGLDAQAELLGGVTVAVRRGRDGERGVVLGQDTALVGRLSAPVLDVVGSGARTGTAELVFDRSGRQVRIELALHADVRGAAARRAGPAVGGERVEANVRLELSDEDRADLRAALRGHPDAVGRLARRLADASRIDVRHLAVRRSEHGRGAGVGLGVGVGVGYEVLDVREDATLRQAYAREPGQGWSHDLDCELAAHGTA